MALFKPLAALRRQLAYRCLTGAGFDIVEAVAADPTHTLLALDFDGTLSTIVPKPDHARLLPASRRALIRLAPHVGGLAIMTGRDARTVVRLGRLDGPRRLPNLVVLGQYGAERWDAASNTYREPPIPATVRVALQQIHDLVTGLESIGWDLRGVLVEDKGRAVGVHTRQTADPDATLALLEPALATIAVDNGLTIEPGRNVIELRAGKIDKGDALAALVQEWGSRVIVYAGDDLGDLPAFRQVDLLQAHGLSAAKVASASPEQPEVSKVADISCDGPRGVGVWLTDLARALTGR